MYPQQLVAAASALTNQLGEGKFTPFMITEKSYFPN
jgi:hypothetical protein